MSEIKLEINGERNLVRMTLPTDPPVSIELDAKDIDGLLQELGTVRSAIKPEFEKDWVPGQKVSAIPDPRWYVEPELMQGHSLLHIRNPFFGWAHYLIPRKEAKQLGEYLISQADAPAPELKSDKLN